MGILRQKPKHQGPKRPRQKKRKTQGKAKQTKESTNNTGCSRDVRLCGDFDNMKATIAAQQKLLQINESKEEFDEYAVLVKVINDDTDLDTQVDALKSFLSCVGANFVKLGAKALADFDCYTTCTVIIDSGSNATFVTSNEKTE